jgi:hypothetical protein
MPESTWDRYSCMPSAVLLWLLKILITHGACILLPNYSSFPLSHLFWISQHLCEVLFPLLYCSIISPEEICLIKRDKNKETWKPMLGFWNVRFQRGKSRTENQLRVYDFKCYSSKSINISPLNKYSINHLIKPKRQFWVSLILPQCQGYGREWDSPLHR